MKRIGRILVIFLLIAHQSSAIFAQSPVQEKQKAKATLKDRIVAIAVGVIGGAMAGAAVGKLIGTPKSSSYEIADLCRGALIGASLMPFLTYETLRRDTTERASRDQWHIVFGGDLTYSNHRAANLQPGYGLSIGRSYRLSERLSLQGEGMLRKRRLSFRQQRLLYSSPGIPRLLVGDISFSVTYVDVALLGKLRVLTFSRGSLNAALGAGTSVPILDQTKYSIQTRFSRLPTKPDSIPCSSRWESGSDGATEGW